MLSKKYILVVGLMLLVFSCKKEVFTPNAEPTAVVIADDQDQPSILKSSHGNDGSGYRSFNDGDDDSSDDGNITDPNNDDDRNKKKKN
jgi:hypothetical protein